MSVQAYPLSWPQGFPRAKFRESSRLRSGYDTALANVQRSLRAFGLDSNKKVEHAIMSSNVTLTDSNPSDPGVAVWFMWDGMQVCIPVDRYNTVAANLQAIHHIIEARRVELRHGTLALVRATFQGFLALPAPAGKHWRDILALPKGHLTTSDVEMAFKRLATERHPDRGGSSDAMAELNNARALALKEIGASELREILARSAAEDTYLTISEISNTLKTGAAFGDELTKRIHALAEKLEPIPF